MSYRTIRPKLLPILGLHLIALATGLERIGNRRIVSGDRTTPWTGTVHHLSRGQRQ